MYILPSLFIKIIKLVYTTYFGSFQMHGEKVEEVEELRLDLADVKEMYKAQVSVEQMNSEGANAGTEKCTRKGEKQVGNKMRDRMGVSWIGEQTEVKDTKGIVTRT